jgi:hypothetical protein
MSANLRNCGTGLTDLGIRSEVMRLRLRCECGEWIESADEDELLRLTRRHLRDLHPDLDSELPAGAILAMAEQRTVSS